MLWIGWKLLNVTKISDNEFAKANTPRTNNHSGYSGHSFGLVIGVWSMQKKVEQAEFERKLMMYHAEEMTEVVEILMMQTEQRLKEQ